MYENNSNFHSMVKLTVYTSVKVKMKNKFLKLIKIEGFSFLSKGLDGLKTY